MWSFFPKHHRADLDRPDSGMPVQLDCQRLRGKLMARDMRQHAGRVDIDGVASRRLDDRHATVGDMAPEVVGRGNPVLQIIRIEDLLQPNGNGFEVASGKAAISWKA